MALTPSNMLPLGTLAAEFTLKDVTTDSAQSLMDLVGSNGTLVMFICNHCPFVKHINSELVRLAKDYLPKGFGFIAISSNDIEKYPQDGPKHMKSNAQEQGFIFPYLYDESQAVAKAYDAACTPDFYVFDKSLKLVYRGQLDDSRPGNSIPVTGRDLRAVFDALLSKTPIPKDQKPSIGCNIKWK